MAGDLTTTSAEHGGVCACGNAAREFAPWWVPIHTAAACWLQSGAARTGLAGEVDGAPLPPWYRRLAGETITTPAGADTPSSEPRAASSPVAGPQEPQETTREAVARVALTLPEVLGYVREAVTTLRAAMPGENVSAARLNGAANTLERQIVRLRALAAARSSGDEGAR